MKRFVKFVQWASLVRPWSRADRFVPIADSPFFRQPDVASRAQVQPETCQGSGDCELRQPARLGGQHLVDHGPDLGQSTDGRRERIELDGVVKGLDIPDERGPYSQFVGPVPLWIGFGRWLVINGPFARG
jgi:hypothetical protein